MTDDAQTLLQAARAMEKNRDLRLRSARTMREFDEIGQVIHQFASEDATVVVGTALDPELQDDVRVTVVATGLNRNAIRQPMRREELAMAQVNRPRIVARTGTDDMPADYIQQPSRNPAARAVAEAPKAKPAQAEPQIDYLDIPAFLRRQAD